MITTKYFFIYEIDPEHLKKLASVGKQALVWGTGSLIAARAGGGNKKTLSPEEKRKERKKHIIQGLVGAGAGAAGALV